ncbi:MAG: hypothetical protein HYY16_16575 [Planctomycetes bacterium]|nr:hypothetical protein [Planctomycetota bacterium]
MRRKVGRRGAVLIIVLGVLFVLALLAVTFASLQSLERQVAENYLDGVRAKLLARTGVEHAYSRLTEAMNSGLLGKPEFLKALRYYGRDTAEIGDPALVGAPLDEATSPSLALETIAAGNVFGPLEVPQNPTDAASFTPRNIWVRLPSTNATVPVGVSGIMESGTYGRNSDIFTLCIRDCSGMIYINDGVNESANYGSVTKNLRRILNRLGEIIQVMGLGNIIIGHRPPTGYKSKREVLDILCRQFGEAVGRQHYQNVAPFITAHGWVDRSVANPVPLSDDPSVRGYYDSWFNGPMFGVNNPPGRPAGYSIAGMPGPGTIYFRGDPNPRYRFGRGKDKDGNIPPPPGNRLMLAGNGPGLIPNLLGNQAAVYGMDELFPQWIELTSRAPVNLNAAPREVLMALLADVHGFWVCERRLDSPPAQATDGFGASTFNSTMGGVTSIVHSYDSSGNDCDEFGLLATSYPVRPAPNTGPCSADWIAREIIACRERVTGPNSGINYANTPFGGPFRSWRQFYMFLDTLVDTPVLRDPRAASQNFYYFGPSTTSGNSFGWSVGGLTGSEPFQRSMYEHLGSQAIADAIKANFNPNLHLNETNPDENMNLLVDKTDLIVMSTEGTFFPTGYFEIESLGRVLRPPQAIPDALAVSPANPAGVMAEFRVEAVVKLYDAIRFTSQKDFYGYGPSVPQPVGQPAGVNYWADNVAIRTSLPTTNNGRSIEIGPEPDIGIAPEDCEWDGYITWPTNLGDSDGFKMPGTPVQPYIDGKSGDPGHGVNCRYKYQTGHVMHSHFVGSDWLHHNTATGSSGGAAVEGERRNLSRFTIAGEVNECYPDPLPSPPAGQSEVRAGVYDPTMGPDITTNSGGNRHRLARSFRVPDRAGSGALPNWQVSAPLDMRVDGVYLERHSTLAYWINAAALGLGMGIGHRQYALTFCYWLKPKYYPEMAGKVREYFNWTRMDNRMDIYDTWPIYNERCANPFPMTHYFCPSQRPGAGFMSLEWWGFAPPVQGALTWNGTHGKYVPIRPASMIFLNEQSFQTIPGQWCPARCYSDAGNSAGTPTLNHHLHDVTGYPGNCAGQSISCRRHAAGTYQRTPYYLLRNPLAAGRWMHFMYQWNFTKDMAGGDDPGWTIWDARLLPWRRLYVNGIGHGTYTGGAWNQPNYNTVFGGNGQSWARYSEFMMPNPAMDFGRHVNSNANLPTGEFSVMTGIYEANAINALRIGESDVWIPTAIRGSLPGSPRALRNFAPDATIDEFNLLSAGAGNQALLLSQGQNMTALYRYGRYHIPFTATALGPGPLMVVPPAEGRYVSPRFNLPLPPTLVRALPNPSMALPPVVSGPAVAPPPVPPGAGAAPIARILGVAWTWAGEMCDPNQDPLTGRTLEPVLTNYDTITAAQPQLLRPRLQSYLRVGNSWYGPYADEFFSNVTAPTGGPLLITALPETQNLQFMFNFWWDANSLVNTGFVHAMPYVDDITIYFAGGDTGFVLYNMV